MYIVLRSVIHVRPCNDPPFYRWDSSFSLSLSLSADSTLRVVVVVVVYKERVAQLSGGFRWVRTQIHVLLVCVISSESQLCLILVLCFTPVSVCLCGVTEKQFHFWHNLSRVGSYSYWCPSVIWSAWLLLPCRRLLLLSSTTTTTTNKSSGRNRVICYHFCNRCGLVSWPAAKTPMTKQRRQP